MKALGPAIVSALPFYVDAQLRLAVAIKATFAFDHDRPMVRVDPTPLRGEAGRLGGGDLVPYRPRCDVLAGGDEVPLRCSIARGGAVLLDRVLSPVGASRRSSAPEGPIPALPSSFLWEAFNEAPVEQRIGFLQGDEWISIESAGHEGTRIRAYLPSAYGVARVYGLGGDRVAPEPIPVFADTLILEPIRVAASIVWRGNIALDSRASLEHLHVLAGVSTPSDPVRFPTSIAKAVEPARPPSDWRSGTHFLGPSEHALAAARSDATPFEKKRAGKKQAGLDAGKTLAGSLRVPGPALPFEEKAPASSPISSRTQPSLTQPSETHPNQTLDPATLTALRDEAFPSFLREPAAPSGAARADPPSLDGTPFRASELPAPAPLPPPAPLPSPVPVPPPVRPPAGPAEAQSLGQAFLAAKARRARRRPL